MLFNIEADTGDQIVGYLVPDGYRETPQLGLIGGGQVVWAGEANEVREALVASGRHETGRCGFRIGGETLPDLAAIEDAEVRDLTTGLILYRRPGRRRTHGCRLFRIETRLARLQSFDLAMERMFQGWFPGIDRFGAETVDQVFHLTGNHSVYASGRIWPAAHAVIASGAMTVALAVRDPYTELAERLVILSGTRGPLDRLVSARDITQLTPGADFLNDVSLGRESTVRRMLRRMPREAVVALANPLARQLTCRHSSEHPGPGAVASALRTLAGFDVVALEEADGYFDAALAGVLRGIAGLPALPKPDPLLADLADTLASSTFAEALLETDLDIYANISSVFDALGHGGATGTAASGAAEANIRK